MIVPYAPVVQPMLSLKIGGSVQKIVFSDEVLTHFSTHRQLQFWQREAGGQLFASLSGTTINIVKATGPRKPDWRSRFFYFAHRPSEQGEIHQLFKEGLHYVGDWHTHPEKIPKPSLMDIKTYFETFSMSKHDLAGMVFVIVGQESAPLGLYIGICNGLVLTQLTIVNF